MIIYNVTVSLVDQSIHQDWVKWMNEIHIPEVMNTNCFLDNKICRLLVEDEISYAIQYTCKDMDTLNTYQEKYAPQLQEEHNKRYRGKFGVFRTILEVVHQH